MLGALAAALIVGVSVTVVSPPIAQSDDTTVADLPEESPSPDTTPPEEPPPDTAPPEEPPPDTAPPEEPPPAEEPTVVEPAPGPSGPVATENDASDGPTTGAAPQVEGSATGTVNIFKRGDGSSGLDGATFSLVGYPTAPAPSCTTAGGGSCSMLDLVPGTYGVTEVSAPPGFDKITTITQPGTPSNYVKPVTVTAGGAPTVTFVNVHQNPPAAAGCGLRVVLLLDRSGSTAGAKQDYIDASNAFVDALVGSPSEIAIVSFAATASNASGGFVDVSGGAGSLPGVISSVYAAPSGGTDWAAAFDTATGLGGADAAILVTDGAANEPTSPLGPVEEGVASANVVKAAGTHVYAVGIGGTSNLPLMGEAISGGVGNLDAILTDLATELCSGSVEVVKTSTLDSEARLAGATFKLQAFEEGWVDTGDTCTTTTAGTCDFPGLTPGGAYRVVETTPPPGYAFPNQPAQEPDVIGGESTTLTFADPPLLPATINVTKKLNGATSEGWPFLLTLPPGVTSSSVPPNGSTGADGEVAFTVDNLPASGGQVTVTEGTIPGFGFMSATCGIGSEPPVAGSDGSVVLPDLDPGETANCTFNNSTNTATVTVHKVLDGEPAGGWRFDAEVSEPTTVSPGSGQTNESGELPFTVGRVLADGSVLQLSEVLEAGYDFEDVECLLDTGEGFVTVEIGTAGTTIWVPVNRGDDIHCYFENSTNEASVTVVKNLDGEPAEGWTFDAAVTDPETPTTATPPSGETGSDGTLEFALTRVLASGSSLNLTETLRNGYTLEDVTCVDGETTLEISREGATATLTVDPGDEITCTFDNSTNTASVTVLKRVDGEPAAGWTFDAATDSESPTTVDPTSGQTNNDGALDFALSRVLANGSGLSLTETLRAGYTLEDVTCVDGETTLEISREGATATLTVDPGDEITCTFDNSTNTASVTVLKRVDGEPAAGWTFDAATDSESPTTVDPTSGQTGSAGEVDFALSRVLANGSGLTLTETPRNGFSFLGVECIIDTGEGDIPVQVGIQGTTASLTVHPGDDLTCTFDNSTNVATVTVRKLLDGIPAAGWTFGASVGAPTTLSRGSGQTNSAGELDFALSRVRGEGSGLTLTETLPEGFTLDGADCVTASGPPTTLQVTGSAGTLTVFPGDDITCAFRNSSPPPPPPPLPPPPPPPPTDVTPVPPPPEAIPPVEEVATPRSPRTTRIDLARSSFRRAFLPGQPVPLSGSVPEGCLPTLVVDGEPGGLVDVNDDGKFSIDVDTGELTPGYHVARVSCAEGDVLESTFYVATPQSSSSTLSVVLVALFALGALGWVGLRGFIGGVAR